jgi:hypothetical protein
MRAGGGSRCGAGCMRKSRICDGLARACMSAAVWAAGLGVAGLASRGGEGCGAGSAGGRLRGALPWLRGVRSSEIRLPAGIGAGVGACPGVAAAAGGGVIMVPQTEQ